MRKTLAGLMLAFAFFVPGVLLTACGQSKVVSFEVEIANSEYELVQNQVVVQWGNKVEISPEDFVVTATLDNDKTKVLSVKSAVKDGYTFSSTIPDDTITPVGEYTLTFTYGDLDPYEIGLVVEKANMDMSGVTWNYTDPIGYDGNEKTVAVTGLPSGVAVTYQGDVAKTAIGSYTATAIFSIIGPNASNYNPIANMTLNWEIVKGTIDTSSVVWNYTTPFVYDGTAKTVAISGLPQGCGISYTGTFSATNAGEYTATASISVDPMLYNEVEPIVLNWKIEKADLNPVASITEIEKTYTGADITITPEMITGLPANYVVSAITGDVTAKNVGEYNITIAFEYTGENAENYNEIPDLNWTWAITPAPLSLTPYAQAVYGQEVSEIGFEGAFLGTDDKTVLKGEAQYAHNYEVGNNAGDYALTLSGLTADNYVVTFEEGTLVVDKAPLTLTAYAGPVVYGDRIANNSRGYTAEGFVCGDTENVITGNPGYEHNYNQFDAPGEYKICLSSTYSDLTAQNYELIFVDGKIICEKRPLTITANDAEVVIGNEAVNAGVIYEGFAGTETESVLSGTLVYDFGGYDPLTAQIDDTFAITPSGLTSENYEITYAPGTLTVVIPEGFQEEIDGIALSVNEFDYVEDTQPTLEVDLATIPEQVEVGTITVKEGEAILPGTYTAVIELNYTGSETYTLNPIERTFTINKVEIDPSEIDALNSLALTQDAFVYDGTEKTVTLANLPAWAKISESTNVSGTVVGSWGATFVITVSDESFYVAFEPVSITRSWNITRAELTITVNDNTIAYGEEAANAGFTANGLVGNDTKDVITGFTYYYGGYEIGSSVGEYELTIENANAGNYNITIVPGTLIVEKAKIDLIDVTWGTQTEFLYTGEAITPTLQNIPTNLPCELEYIYIYYDANQEECTPTEEGVYTAVATISTTNSNCEIINIPADFQFTISTSVDIFASLTLNGADFAEENLVDGVRFEYGSVLAFTLTNGYYATDNENIEISSITFDENYTGCTLTIYAGAIGGEIVKSISFGSPYLLPAYTVNGQTYTYEEDYDVQVDLGLDEEEITINFDSTYFDKYSYHISLLKPDGQGSDHYVGSLPYVVEEAYNLSAITLFALYNNAYISVIQINVGFENPFTEMNFTLVSPTETSVVVNLGASTINLNNQVIASVECVDEDENVYNNIKVFEDYSLTQEVDMLDLASYDNKPVFFAVYDSQDTLIAKLLKKISHSFVTDSGFTTAPVFAVHEYATNGANVATVAFTTTNPDVTINTTLNGETQIEVTTEYVQNVNFRFELVYQGQTYFFESVWTVFNAYSATQFINDENIQNTNSAHTEEYSCVAGNLNLFYSDYFNASNIKDFEDDLEYLEFDLVEGYTISTRALTQIGNDFYVELSFIDAEEQDAGKCFIKLFFEGFYDNDTEVEAYLVSMVSGEEQELVIEEDQITITDMSAQVFLVAPMNMYASLVLTNGEGQEIANNEEDGYIIMQFTQAGTYSLIVYATDGTPKTYTIIVEGEYIPALEITVGTEKFVMEVDMTTGKQSGDFYSDMNQNLIAYIGADKVESITEGKLAITSLRSSMLTGAVIADQDGTVLTSTQLEEGFSLEVLYTEENAEPYVKLNVTISIEGETQETAIILYLTEPQSISILKVEINDEITLENFISVSDNSISGDFDVTETEAYAILSVYLNPSIQSEINQETNTLTISSIEFFHETSVYRDGVSGAILTSPENVALEVGNQAGIPYVSFAVSYTVGSVNYLIIVIMMLDQPLFEIKYNNMVLTEFMFTSENPAPTFMGDFEVTNQDGTIIFVGYLGEYEGDLPQTITINSATCNQGETFKDGFSNTEIFKPFTNVALTVGTYNEQPAVSIFVDSNIQIYLLLADNYPATFTLGQEVFDVQISTSKQDMGDLQIVASGLALQISQEVESLTVTYNKTFTDLSYSVITDSASIFALVAGEITLAELIEDGKVYSLEENATSYTAPLTFVDGVATIIVCIEGCTGEEVGESELSSVIIPVIITVVQE